MNGTFRYSDWCQHLEAVGKVLHTQPELVKDALCETPVHCFQQDMDESGSAEVVESWLSLCLEYCRHLVPVGETEEAILFLQLAYARLQMLATPGSQSVSATRWAMKKLDGVVVMIIETCQHLPEEKCLHETTQTIEQHVAFMNANHHLNLSDREFIR